jgi:hypothetical protein
LRRSGKIFSTVVLVFQIRLTNLAVYASNIQKESENGTDCEFGNGTGHGRIGRHRRTLCGKAKACRI